MLKASHLAIMALALGLLISGCDSQGPAEEAGEKIDNTVEQAKEKLDEAIDEPNEGPAEEAGEKIDEAVDATKEKLEDAKETIEEQTD